MLYCCMIAKYRVHTVLYLCLWIAANDIVSDYVQFFGAFFAASTFFIVVLRYGQTTDRRKLLIYFGFCPSLVTRRSYSFAASQVPPFSTWSTAVRLGVGLGVVGGDVAGRKPPLGVVAALRPSLYSLSPPPHAPVHPVAFSCPYS